MTADLKNLRIDRSHKSPAIASAKPWRWVVVAVGIAIAIVGYVVIAHATAAVDVHTVRVRAAATGQVDDVVLNATGYIVAAHKIEMAPKVSGRAAWVGVDMGDKVHQGDVLVRLEDEEFAAQVRQQQGQYDAAVAKLQELQNGSRPQEIDQAKAELDQSTATLADAKSNVERLRELGKTKAVSQQAIEDAEAAYGQATAKVAADQAAFELVRLGPRKEEIDMQKAQVEQMQGMLDLSKVYLANTVIRAPVDGVILDRNVELGEYVTTGFVSEGGAKGYVVSMADLRDLRVELDIAQSDFNKVAPAQRCTVTTDAYPDHKYDGVVDRISPEANRSKATVLVKVKILSPDDLLKPDMNASVGFHHAGATTEPANQAAQPDVTVPAAAVRDGKVFVVEDDKAVERKVEVGAKSSEGMKILSGVSVGEDIIVDPPAGLKSGSAVRASDESGGGK